MTDSAPSVSEELPKIEEHSTSSSEVDCSQDEMRFKLKESWSCSFEGQAPARGTLLGYSQAHIRWLHQKAAKHISSRGDELQHREGLAASSPGGSTPWFVSAPGGRVRLAWEIFGCLLIFCDLILLPLQVFEPPMDLIAMLDWVSIIYWSANVGATLTVGYFDKGKLVMCPRKICLNYLKTWFLIDFVLIVPDWVMLFMTLESSEASAVFKNLEIVRGVRTLRWLRLGRTTKLKWMLRKTDQYLESEYASVVAHICKMFILLLVVTHFVACVWFAVSDWSRYTYSLPCWIEEYGFEDAAWYWQYSTAFHWAITQFTPSSMNVHAKNSYESAVSIVVVVFGLIGFSYVVGSLTGSLGQLRDMSQQTTKEFWKLRCFLRKSHVRAQLATRIEEYVQYEVSRRQKVMPKSSVSMLNMLPEQMTMELNYELTVASITIHPLFVFMQTEAVLVLQKLCFTAISQKQVAAKELIFIPDQRATHMYFVSHGALTYFIMDGVGNYADRDAKAAPSPTAEEDVEAKIAWVSEAVLWAESWKHLGFFASLKESELLCVSSTAFSELLSRDCPLWEIVLGYARSFLAELNAGCWGSEVARTTTHSQTLSEFLPYNPMGYTSSSGYGWMRRTTSKYRWMEGTSVVTALNRLTRGNARP